MPSNTTQSPTITAQSLKRSTPYRNRPIQPKPHDLRQVSLPAHFANNSNLNIISFGTNQTPSKFNVASSSSSKISYTYFRPITSAPATPSVAQPTSLSTMTTSTTKGKQRTLTAVAYRPASSSTSSGSQKILTTDHPTTQKSSCKAAQNHSGRPDTYISPRNTASSSASEISSSKE